MQSGQMQMMANSQTNTNIADSLTDLLYSTIDLATGATEFYPFSKRFGDAGENYGRTNVELGNQVPAKQSWAVTAFKIAIYNDAVLTPAEVATLISVLSETDLFFQVDNSPKIHIPLTEALGLSSGIVTADATNNHQTNIQNVFGGQFKFKGNPFLLGPQTSFEMRLKHHATAGIPAELNGVKIRISMVREYDRLV